jgi:formylglycine-generating enzyme required for sulfatase activity
MADNAKREPKQALRVFLCHATGDKPAVRALHQRLCAEGIDAWLDEEKLLPGQKWQFEIPKAVRASDVVIVCLSRKSINKAGYVQKEITFALDVADEQPEGAIFLIPARLEECDVPDRLSQWHWVSLFEERGYDRLMRALRARAADLGASLSQPPARADELAHSSRKETTSEFDSVGQGRKSEVILLQTHSSDSSRSAAQAVTTGSPPSVSSIDRAELRRKLAERFNKDELRTLCFDLGVEYENLPETKDGMARELVAQCERRGRLAELLATYERLRPTSGVGPPVSAAPLSSQASVPQAASVSAPRYTQMFGGLEFVGVPNGKFIMGSKDDNTLARDDEKPQHTVEIPYDYGIARYPVTNGQFAKFVEATQHKHEWVQDWKSKKDHPVVNVSWHDAVAYCKWLSETLRGEIGDGVVRLPTEAEWEKAARGKYGNEWPWGNEFDKTKCNSSEGGKGGTTPVGAYSPQGDSPYGAADMVGNAWEWTQSLLGKDASRPDFKYPYNPKDGREKLDAGRDVLRVLRGGSWNYIRWFARCAFRFGGIPDFWGSFIGFRVVVSLAGF